MRDRKGNVVAPGCMLQSELAGKDGTKVEYESAGIFLVPGGGTMYHTEESLLSSYWVVVEYPSESKKKKSKETEDAKNNSQG